MILKQSRDLIRRVLTKPERLIANIRVGRAEAQQNASSHIPGVKQGNARPRGKHAAREREAGIHRAPDGGARATARRSTGINPKAHDPIDPRMPNLPPP